MCISQKSFIWVRLIPDFLDWQENWWNYCHRHGKGILTALCYAASLRHELMCACLNLSMSKRWEIQTTANFLLNLYQDSINETVADVPESWVWWRADFQSVSGMLQKMFWTFSYLYLWHTMWFHAEKLLKTLKFWKSLNSLYKSGSPVF